MSVSARRGGRGLAAALALAAVALAGCGSSASPTTSSTASAADSVTTTVARTTVQVTRSRDVGPGFDAAGVYRDDAPGVVTVISVLDAGAAQGSGFVLNRSGEVATNAHVVTSGKGGGLTPAKQVYVKFADGNEVPAKVLGADPNEDVALLEVDPSGLDLQPLPLGSSANLTVGMPVAAIGSPFGEPQSLTVGVVSALHRSIESLTRFQIDGAIQTDTAINHGNSGGPLVDAHGRVIGINSQIESSGGGNEGVGFAIPIDAVRRSLSQLREHGEVRYPYLGVATVPMYPQLAEHLGLDIHDGAFVQQVVADGPAAHAGIREAGPEIHFQAESYCAGGDVITGVAGRAVHNASDLSRLLLRFQPGATVALRVARKGASARTVHVKLGERPSGSAGSSTSSGC